MPELPEVQTIVTELDDKLSRHIVKNVEVFKYKSVRPMNKNFVQAIIGKKILGVTRRAKMIIIDLSGKKYLLIHLKMTGQLVYCDRKGCNLSGGHGVEKAELPNKFTRVAFTFNNGAKLFFNDIRRFGWIKFVDQKVFEVETAKYGLEPLEGDFTFKNFKEKITKYPNRKIKQALMDQSLIAGVGNIYADEACFASRVMPTRLAGDLTEAELKALYKSIPRILKLAVKLKGTSADTYVTTSGEKGGMLKYLKVYGREGQSCRGCAGKVQKIKLGGRGTHFCPVCQK